MNLMTIGAKSMGQNAAIATYAEILRDTYGASEIWPLVNISAGTTISAFINSNRNGTLQGWDLKNAAGPVTGTLAPYSDGTNDYGNIYTSNGSDGLNDIFNGGTGALFIWAKSIAIDAMLFQPIRVDNDNLVYIYYEHSSGQVQFRYEANNTRESINTAHDLTAAWTSIGMSWDIGAGINGEVRGFVNGSQVGSTQTGLGTWVGANLNSTLCQIAAYDTTPLLVFGGWVAYAAVKFDSVWSPADFAAMHAAAATAGAD